MKKIMVLFGGVIVLLFLYSIPVQAQNAAPKTTVHHGTTSKPATKAKKPAVIPVVTAKPKPAKRASGGLKVMYIKAAAPWFTNLWILFFAGSMLILIGGFIGRILSFGSIPRQEDVKQPEVQIEQEDWLKNIFKCFQRKPKPISSVTI